MIYVQYKWLVLQSLQNEISLLILMGCNAGVRARVLSGRSAMYLEAVCVLASVMIYDRMPEEGLGVR